MVTSETFCHKVHMFFWGEGGWFSKTLPYPAKRERESVKKPQFPLKVFVLFTVAVSASSAINQSDSYYHHQSTVCGYLGNESSSESEQRRNLDVRPERSTITVTAAAVTRHSSSQCKSVHAENLSKVI